MTALIVLKVSGHLIKFPDSVRALMDTVMKLVDEGIRIAIVPGGSVFADIVKEIQDRVKLNDDISHWMAVKAMEIYGLYLKHFCANCREVYALDHIYRTLDERSIPIIMPYGILKAHDDLPHTWDVTSDSISIFIAKLLKANMAILGKIVDGILDEKGNPIKILRLCDVKEQNVLDRYAIDLAKMYGMPLAIFNILKPLLLYKVVRMESDSYTLIIP